MRICDEWVEKGCRRGSSGERDSWKDAGEGMEGGDVVGRSHFEGANVSFSAFFKATLLSVSSLPSSFSRAVEAFWPACQVWAQDG